MRVGQRDAIPCAALSFLGRRPALTPAAPHHSVLPRPSHHRSRHCRHTATAWRCSDGSGTRTGPLSRTCLGQSEATVRWGSDLWVTQVPQDEWERDPWYPSVEGSA